MNPIEEFCFLKNNVISKQSDSLIQLYFPIIGNDAAAVYDFLHSFFDNGTRLHKFSEILNHLQFGMSHLKNALDILMAVKLIECYQIPKGYLIKLCPAYEREQFLETPVLRKMLEKKIGEVAVSELLPSLPADAKKISKNLSDIFSDTGDLIFNMPISEFFDMDNFKTFMARDGLRFLNEQDDALALAYFAEKYQLNWFNAYKIAKETAIDNVISLERMKVSQERPVQSTVQEFSDKELSLIRAAKIDSAKEFLTKIKKVKRAVVTAAEEKTLVRLAEMGFLDEVINVMVLYTLNRTKSANLNPSYIMKIANDFSYQSVYTVEEAVVRLRGQKRSVQKKKNVSQNVPDWSKKELRTEATEEEKAKLEELKKSMLED